MQSVTIRHVTTYRYRRPVSFGEHRLVLRPREWPSQKILGSDILISPKPESLRFIHDAFGNQVGIATFGRRARKLRFESVVRLRHAPIDVAALGVEDAACPFPIRYSDDEAPDLAHCVARSGREDDEVAQFAKRIASHGNSSGPLGYLSRLSQEIHSHVRYRRREEKGIQCPLETLRLAEGTCRDYALLMIDAARAMGFAARFASGYLALPGDGGDCEQGGATHAWAQVYLPGAGWIDFDASRGSTGSAGLVTVAVVRDPLHALPLYGSYVGTASDHLGMEVNVRITVEAAGEGRAARKRVSV